ncbi:MAG: hypothetical protein Q9225_007042 [Loekoesia sp. 1 TL-2023]
MDGQARFDHAIAPEEDEMTTEAKTTTYTFCLDDNPMFCVIFHFVALALSDKSFQVAEATPRVILTLRVPEGLSFQPIKWHEKARSWPVSRSIGKSDMDEGGLSQPLSYSAYQNWVKRLGEETGFVYVLIRIPIFLIN